jgi:hypothetical protein
MVRGMELFRGRFAGFEDSFVLIGGAACDEWFTSFGQGFRATKDLDVVLIIETMDPVFLRTLRSFIAEGGYEIRERTEGVPSLHRFAGPRREGFPFILEFFSRKPDGIELSDDQKIIPIPTDAEYRSFSAILLDEDYYSLVRQHREIREGIPIASTFALIPLKARAWINLTRSEATGEQVDSRNITKHRNDVFKLAGILTGGSVTGLPASIKEDLRQFLKAFPEDSPEWAGILSSLKPTLGGGIKPADLIAVIQNYFRLLE